MVRRLPANSIHPIGPNTLVTPLARQVAMERSIALAVASELVAAPGASDQAAAPATRQRPGPAGDSKVVALGADHGGYQLKDQIKTMLASAKPAYTIIDCGTHSAEPVDYPDYAYAVARLVADGRAWRGIIIDGAGIGSCMAANKVPGVRAAMCYDQATAVNSREHNNANVLTLGAGLIGLNLAAQIVNTWLATEFGGGRHARRVDKIDQLDQRYSK
jgi:ribose 5-phosphate isomerase B